MSNNIQIVQDAYAAFGRGDVAAILASLDENVQWQGLKGAEGVAPHSGRRRGKDAVREFFALVAQTTEFHRFEPREFIDGGDKVAVVGEYEATVRPSGRRVSCDWVMVFTLAGGKITEFREFTDSAQVVAAFGPSAAV
jgi:ketosteroid isomerase-like protein